MEERTGYFVNGPPEIYFNKPGLRRQRVIPRRRSPELTAKLRKQLTTARMTSVTTRFWRRWFSWFPLLMGDKV